MIARLLISPSLEARGREINKILKEQNLSANHPDLLYFPGDSKLGIAEARIIKGHLSFKSFSGKVRGVVLEDASSLTVEAQNALLKTLEELPEDGLFILGADSDAKLLSTVISRCETVILTERSNYNNYLIEKLIDLDIEQRFEYVEKLKDREEFLHEMVSFFRHKLTESTTHERGSLDFARDRRLANLKQFLKDLLQAEQWAAQNVNIRAILEYLMLVMPQDV